MTTTDRTAVTCEVWIAASAETVFEFLVDRDKLMRWKGIEADIDPRPGGLYRVNLSGRDIARGEYVAVERPTRVVFTWGWEGESHAVPPGSSTVEITLTPEREGTRVRLTHRDLPAPAANAHREGWQHYLDRLAIAAAGGDPGPDPLVQRAMDERTSS